MEAIKTIRDALRARIDAGEKALAALSVVGVAFGEEAADGADDDAGRKLTARGRKAIADAQKRRHAKRRCAKFVAAALSQVGKPYEWGAEVDGEENPEAFDCSELVQWAAQQAGIEFVDGSQNQRAAVGSMALGDAIKTRGALLFTDGHVAISLGDGTTVEAKNRASGVDTFQAGDRFLDAGIIPGMQ